MKPISAAEVLCQKVAAAFSRLEKPALTEDDDLQALRDLFIRDPQGLARLDEAVRELSRGQVAVQVPGPEDQFNLEVYGPAKYLVLVGNGRRQRVIFSPGHPFFIFEK